MPERTVGIASDFKIFPEMYWGGVIETLQQNTNAFNGASMNALRLVTRAVRGDYEKESFLKLTTGIVRSRNNLVVTDVDDKYLEHGEFVGVKVNKGIGPFAETLDAFKKVQQDPAVFSVMLGQQTGVDIAVDYIDTAIACANAGIAGVGAALTYDARSDSTPTLNHTAMVEGLAKFGDASSRIRVWVMHSKPFFDLMKQQIADKLFEVAGATVYAGTIATFNRPVVVLDSTSLTLAGDSSTTNYAVLGLTEDACTISESEERTIVSQLITGKENLIMRIQGEYAFNVNVKGCAWDLTNGGTNPSAAALATSTNWDKVVTSDKQMGGVRILVK